MIELNLVAHRRCGLPDFVLAGRFLTANRNLVLKSLIAAALCLISPTASLADAWVEKMLQKKSHDFGSIKPGAEVSYRFPITNIYKHKIRLESIRSSCGCTAQSLESHSIEPGETSYIIAKVNANATTGVRKSILTLEASWDDNGVKRAGQATLDISATIEKTVRVDPPEINFANVIQGTTAHQAFQVFAASEPNWRVKNVQCSCEYLQCDLSPRKLEAEYVRYDALVKLGANMPVGTINERVTLESQDQHAPKIDVSVSGEVVADFSAAPALLDLGNAQAGERIVKKVVLRTGSACEVISAQSDDESISFRATKIAPNRQILEIAIPVGRQLGALKRTLTIRSDTGKTASVLLCGNVVRSKPTD